MPPSTLVVLKIVGPHNPRGATSEESLSKSALQVLSYARFLACAVRTEVQHPRRHTRDTHTHGSSTTLQSGSQLCASPPPSTRGRSNAEKHRTASKSASSALKTNVHQFCMRAKDVAATSSDTPLTSPIVIGWPALVCNKRGFLISCSIAVVWPG